MMKPVAKEAKMNKAEAHEPKSGADAPAAKGFGKSADAGNESKPNMTGGFSSAAAELHAQHPHEHYEHGPHHGTSDHIRHKPYKMS